MRRQIQTLQRSKWIPFVQDKGIQQQRESAMKQRQTVIAFLLPTKLQDKSIQRHTAQEN